MVKSSKTVLEPATNVAYAFYWLYVTELLSAPPTLFKNIFSRSKGIMEFKELIVEMMLLYRDWTTKPYLANSTFKQ